MGAVVPGGGPTETDMSRASFVRVWSRCERVALLAFVVAVGGACDPDPRFDSGCPSGTAGCPCFPDGTCEDGEGQCLEDLCVRAPVDEPIPPQDHDAGAAGAGGARADD